MRTCVACGRENPPDAGFCNGCGVALLAAPAPRQQRKTVTVLFCDVTGSTALGERLDPESLRQVLRRYFDAARKVIEQHGGTVEKFIGDAVMAVFGVPVLHEDDALRAVRAATALRTALADLNRELKRDYGTTLSIRTGINTGQVVTGTEERLATGDAVNVAARLEQAAAPGEIVVGAETERLVRDAVIAQPLESLELKGKSLPVSAYRILEITGHEIARVRGSDVPLVGREHQLKMLHNGFEQLKHERSCTLFTVLGAAGVGKSRLTAEFVTAVDATVLRGRCLSYGEGITYWPVVSMVKQMLLPGEDPGPAELMSLAPTVAAAINVLLGEQGTATSATEIAWAVRKLLESVADHRPLVVIFDDLHWAEPTLLDLIEHIADLSRDAAMLVLCLARPELLDRRPSWGGGKLNATTVLLEPLDADETEVLIDELLPHGGGINPQLRARVRATAAGNPLFVEEMLAMLQESGSHDVVVPPTIQALLAARLDQLQPEERAVLERGSVEGQSFHLGAVQVMTPDEHDVSGKLTTLVRKDLVRPDRPVFTGEDAFRFRHLLIRDAAYEVLSKAERAELHECFAGWLLQRPGDLVELDEIAGHHLEQAYRYRAELGAVDEKARRLAVAAAERLGAAGRRALDRGDVAAAVNLLERAGSLSPSHDVNLALEERLIDGLAMCGRLDDAIARAERVTKLCSAAGDEVGELRAQLIRARWQTNVDPAGHEEELRELVERARPFIERSGDDAGLASLHYTVAYVAHYRCRFADALASLTRAMEHAKNAHELWFERTMHQLAADAMALGPAPVADVLAWLEERLAEDPGLPVLGIRRASVLAHIGRFEEARAVYAKTVNQLSERGLTTWVAAAAQNAWEIEMLAGDPIAAERVIRQGCEQLERLGEGAWLSTHACRLADALCALGRYKESEEWVSRGLELGSDADVLTQIVGLQVRSKLLARQGHHRQALELAQSADTLARATDAPVLHGDGALALAEVLYLGGDRTRGDAEVERAIGCYQGKGATACITRARGIGATLRDPRQ